MKRFLETRTEHFRTRFHDGEGIIDTFLCQMSPHTPSSIIVDHNDYLSASSSHSTETSDIGSRTMMSAIFMEKDKSNNYHKIREDLAQFVRMPACYIPQSGMAANVNVVETVYAKGMPIYIDQKAHASFWSGIKCAMGMRDVRRFRHNDVAHLKELTAEYGPGLILVESVYSTCGSFGPIKALAELRDQEGHILVVDESHSLGLYGQEGSGYCSHLGVKADFITASLSKAVSVRAGVVACDYDSIRYMAEIGTAAVFSSVVEARDVEAINKSVSLIRTMDAERRHIMRLSYYLREQLTGLYQIEATPLPSPIFGLTFKTEVETQAFQRYLQEKGVFGAVFCKPATSLDASLVRLTINSHVTMEQIETIVCLVKSYQPGAAKL